LVFDETGEVIMALVTRTARGKFRQVEPVAAVLPDGRSIEPGSEVSIRGWSGRYVYTGWSHADGSLSLWGGVESHEQFRAAMPAMVKRVHRIHKRRSAVDG
jgi:hypothetical protein